MKILIPFPSFVFGCSLLFCLSACQPVEEAISSQPNIVFLFADDQTFHSIQSLGNESIHTPNLDRLVENGTSFTHAYNMGGWHGAICVASRSMVISGAYLWEAQDYEKKWKAGDSTALSQTWGRIMARNNYNTYFSGKWHVAAPADIVFDTAANIRPGMPRDTWGRMEKEEKEKIRTLTSEVEDLKPFMPVGYHRPNDENDQTWSPSDPQFGGFWEGGKHWSEVLRDDALHFIEEATPQDEPFFMYLAFNAPHDPRQSPQEFVDQYPLEQIPLPDNWLPVYPGQDQIGCGPTLRDEALAPFPRTPYAIKTHMQEYYAIITHLDAQVGKILDALEASGEMDNTYIFFTADHGLSVGQHGLLGKQNMYDHSMRVPFMVMGPDIPKGHRVEADIYLQDIMPTSLELAGIEQPDHVSFHSLLDLIKGNQLESSYNGIYGAYRDRQRMIRKDGFKLIFYPALKQLKLFDLENDPLEMKDLSKEEAYQEKVKTLYQEFQDLQMIVKDTLDMDTFYTL